MPSLPFRLRSLATLLQMFNVCVLATEQRGEQIVEDRTRSIQSIVILNLSNLNLAKYLMCTMYDTTMG